MANPLLARVLDGFDDPAIDADRWNELVLAGGDGSVYLTWEFQRAWWETLGRGRLLIVVVERDSQPIAIAPLYADCGMIYFIGSAFDSDYLGFIGDVRDPEVLATILSTARDDVAGFLGFRFYFLPQRAAATAALPAVAERLGMACFGEDDMPAPVLDLAAEPAAALAAANRPTFLKIERAFLRGGPLHVARLDDGASILPQLPEFFEQHVARWAGTPTPSRFTDPDARRLIERFTARAADTRWLRFTRIEWQGRPIAFHYGYCLDGRYYWGMPTFAVDLARESPGQLLIRHLLLAAVDERARVFDFGTGDQAFKTRLASRVERVRTWGLYPVAVPIERTLHPEGVA
jgi:CelD/BcsL family acetyltransferase involved in cellulose biosynthesis